MDIGPAWSEHQQKLWVFIRSRVKNECDAKDILHQVYLKAREKSATLRDQGKVLNWLYRITRNDIIDYYRSHKNTINLDEELPAVQNEKNTWALISRCVRPFIEELPGIYREVLLLSEIEGMNQAQVSKKLKIPLATAKARIQRGRKKLRQKFDACCIFECSPRGAKIHSETFGKEEE